MQTYTCTIYRVAKTPTDKPVRVEVVRIHARTTALAKTKLKDKLQKMGKRVRTISSCPNNAFVAYVVN